MKTTWCIARLLAFLLLTPAAAQAQTVAPRPPSAPEPRAIPPGLYVVSPNRAAVAAAIDACAASVACPYLSDFKAQSEQAYRWIQAWCRWLEARGKPPPAATPSETVCRAVVADDAGVLERTPSLALEAARTAIAPPRCDAFGLTVPLYSLRRVRGEVVASGPVKAGLGGGYYFGSRFLGVCREDFTAGPEVFVWSEGLDPGDLFHAGVAAGYQLTAFKHFSIGLAMGYDLYRSTADGQRNGLFSTSNLGKQSVTWLLTLSFSSRSAGGAEDGTAEKP